MRVGYTGFYGVKWGNSDVYGKCTALVASRNGVGSYTQTTTSAE